MLYGQVPDSIQIEGFPTLLFFPSEASSLESEAESSRKDGGDGGLGVIINYTGERDVEAMLDFLQKNAGTPFLLDSGTEDTEQGTEGKERGSTEAPTSVADWSSGSVETDERSSGDTVEGGAQRSDEL